MSYNQKIVDHFPINYIIGLEIQVHSFKVNFYPLILWLYLSIIVTVILSATVDGPNQGACDHDLVNNNKWYIQFSLI